MATMAQTTRVTLVDDLTGEEITDGAGETVTFALDGTTYEIDLSTDNATQLREAFAAYTSAGRKTSGRTTGGAGRRRTAPSSKSTTGSVADPRAVRDWAAKNGIELSSRGRIPLEVVAKYEAAQH